MDAPWAPAGHYTVRLTVNGKSQTQPLTLRLDPRVKTSPAALNQVALLSRQMYDGAVASHAAYEKARGLVMALGSAGGADAAAFAKEVEAVAPAPKPQTNRFFRAAPSGPPTLNGASDEQMEAAMAMQAAEVAATAREVAASAPRMRAASR